VTSTRIKYGEPYATLAEAVLLVVTPLLFVVRKFTDTRLFCFGTVMLIAAEVLAPKLPSPP
jgi:hypothetical protein